MDETSDKTKEHDVYKPKNSLAIKKTQRTNENTLHHGWFQTYF